MHPATRSNSGNEFYSDEETELLRFMNYEVANGVKRQAGSESQQNGVYALVNVNKGGILVDIMRKAMLTGNRDHLDDQLRELVLPFLYNEGRGELIPIIQLVRKRNKERGTELPLIGDTASRRQSSVTADPFVRVRNQCLKSNLLSRSVKRQKVGNAGHHVLNRSRRTEFRRGFREVCWRLDCRGFLGETVIHICILSGTRVHLELVRCLVKLFPKLVNDIYINDEFYGESPLHMAVVNEDVSLVSYLLDYGANVSERCVGRFFCPDDQKDQRLDSVYFEHFILPKKTNYAGHVYWGEFPLSFAACRESEDCFKLLLANGANPNIQDTNGNTCLHMCVIMDKLPIFNLAFEMGADLNIKNRQQLTPLCLAAKLTRIKMFFHILNLQREVYWQFCGTAFVAYPVDEVDSIDVQTGRVSNQSALSVVVFGDEMGHLDMFEGLLMEILQKKWSKFAKKRFYRQIKVFLIHFVVTFLAFLLRPIDPKTSSGNIGFYGIAPPSTCSNTSIQSNITNSQSNVATFPTLDDFLLTSCFLRDNWPSHPSLIYKSSELLSICTSVFYVLMFTANLKHLGGRVFIQTMRMEPGRAMFLLSCLLVLSTIPFRFLCLPSIEERLATCAMFLTPMHVLYFLRGFKTIGPFVVMIYKMLISDLLCFVLIYFIFLIGFAQAFYMIFLSHEGKGVNYFAGASESILSMFLMSLLEFGDLYAEFNQTDHPYLARLLFVSYAILVALLLMNLLIAMMAKTYQEIAARPNEWLRQWARIVLIVERSLSDQERLQFQQTYTVLKKHRRVFLSRWTLDKDTHEKVNQFKRLKEMNRKQKQRRMLESKSSTQAD